ncbi:hypothetical protein [Pedomonas sp. V897]|uniref:hypothetical protein n=1 Tax=Pedomonas sp. V897 TaxID=3446482 RepID=UPI003EE3036E
MDKRVLVADSHTLLRLLDQTEAAPRGALLEYNSCAARWELWVLPARNVDARSFDRRVYEALRHHREQFLEMRLGLSPVIVRVLPESHSLVPALNDLYRLEGLGCRVLGTRRLGEWIVENAILLRWATEESVNSRWHLQAIA